MGRPFILGLDCALYMMPNTQRTGVKPQNPWAVREYANEDFIEVPFVQDATLEMSANMADLTNRASNRFRQNVPTILEAGIQFSMLWRPDDQYWAEFMNRFIDGCPVCCVIVDGEIFFDEQSSVAKSNVGCVGTTPFNVTGLAADFCVSSMTRNENLEEGVSADVNLQPTIGKMYPEYFSIDTGGNPSTAPALTWHIAGETS